MKIKALIINTFKEASRNKVFYLLIFVGVFFALGSQVTSMLTVGDKTKVLKDTGLAAIHFFSVLLTVFTGINLVFKELDRKTIYNILSKPITRAKFILGKFLGLSFTIFTALAGMGVIFAIFLYLSSGELSLRLWLFYLLLFFELMILIAFSLFFSSFATPISSSIFTISIFFVGHILWSFNLFKHKIVTPVFKYFLYLIYYLLPNLEKFNIKSEVVNGTAIEPARVFSALGYGTAYVLGILVLTILIFNKKEFK